MKRVLDPRRFPGEQFPFSPRDFSEFVGQERLKEIVRVALKSAAQRKKPIDHMLFTGPPGLGKTTFARLVAKEQGEFIGVSGAGISRPADMASILTQLSPNAVLFLDEVHRIPPSVLEFLYAPLDEGNLSILMGKGMGARVLKLSLNPFTLIAATTKPSLLPQPFRSRFGIAWRFDFYSQKELQALLQKACERVQASVHPKALEILSSCSRGTPRVALRLLQRSLDFSLSFGEEMLTEKTARICLQKLGIDREGLDEMERKILHLIHTRYNGGPVSLKTLSHFFSEERETIEELYEPYLVKKGFLQIGPRGRSLTEKYYRKYSGWNR
ncbi:MAG: Holliday junction branch migration DNA helicase RuvB [bacterium JZ-2024 1]